MTGQKTKGFSIRIFLPDGNATGLRLVEKSNWSGRGVVCPRSLFPEMKSRHEFNKTGVYIMTGPSEGADLPRVYIGQADPVRPRLESHFVSKDFWTTLVFFTSKDENLNKAHLEYLESRMITLAKEAKRCKLDNGNQPTLPSLSEMDAADAEGFLDEMLLCLPVLGVTVFEKTVGVPTAKQLLYLKGAGIEARGHESPEGFVVLAGSRASNKETPSIAEFLTKLRKSLVENGILLPEGQVLILTQDYTFASPSTAASVMLGRSANGRMDWKNEGGVSLKEIQASQVGVNTTQLFGQRVSD